MKILSRLLCVCVLSLAPFVAPKALDLDLTITGAQPSAASPLVNVQRVELRFPQGGVSPNVPLNQQNWYAQARLRYQGNGLLTVRWLVDGYMIARETHILSFGDDITLRSDHSGLALPTFQPGIHYVTLQLETTGATTLKIPTIHYYVAPRAAEVATATLATLEPSDGAAVDPSKLAFKWNASGEFSGYRVEMERLGESMTVSATKLEAETRRTEFVPAATQWLTLPPGNYRWRVLGFARGKGEPTPWQSLRLVAPATKPGVFLQNVVRAQGPERNEFGALSASTSNAQRVTGKIQVTPDETTWLRLRIENMGPVPSSGAVVELRDVRGPIARQGLPTIGANQFLETTLDWRVPIRITEGNLQIRVLGSDAKVLDETSVAWKARAGTALQSLDFRERSAETFPVMALTDPSSCPKVAGPLGGVGTGGTMPDPNRAFAQVLGIISASGEETKVALNPILVADEGQALRASVYIEDRGLFDSYLAKWRSCRENVIDALRASGLGSQQFIELQDEARNCRTETRNEACAKTLARYSDVLRALGGDIDLVSEPPDSVPLELIAYPAEKSGVKSAPVELGVVRLHRGEKNIVRSPVWRVPRNGRYVLSVHGLGRSAKLVAKTAHGLPAQLDMAGFTLRVLSYDANASLDRLSGSATTTWRNDTLETELPLKFEARIAPNNRDPLHARAISGRASLTPGANPVIAPSGQRLTLQKLELTSDKGKANFRYRFPEAVTSDHPGVTFADVSILNGGEFITEKTIDNDVPPLLLPTAGGTVTLAGATLALDLSPHLADIRLGDTQTLISVTLHNAQIRTRAFATAAGADGFLSGHAATLRVTDTGLSGNSIDVSAGAATLANGATLNVSGGNFDLIDGRLGGVLLSGQYRESGPPPNRALAFQRLIRVTAANAGVLGNRVPPGYASEALESDATGSASTRLLWPGLEADSSTVLLAGAYGLSSMDVTSELASSSSISVEESAIPTKTSMTVREPTTGLRANTVAGRAERTGGKTALVRFWKEAEPAQFVIGETTASGQYNAALTDGTWIGSACAADEGYEPTFWHVTFADGKTTAIEELTNRSPTIEKISDETWRPGQKITVTGLGFGCAGKLVLNIIPDGTRLLRSPSLRELTIEIGEFTEQDDAHVSFVVPALPTVAYSSVAALGASEQAPMLVTKGTGSLVFENAGLVSEKMLFAYESEGSAR